MAKMRLDITYLHNDCVPLDGAMVKIHACQLGFLYECSTRLWPYPCVCREVFDDILCNGFRSTERPMIVMMPPQLPGEDEPLHLHFVKGMARSCTLLAIIDACIQLGISLSDISVELLRSCADINAVFRDLTSVQAALENASLSARLSITKIWDAVTWTGVLLKLQHANTSIDASAVIKQYNERCSGRASLQGQKRVSVMNLLTRVDKEVPTSVM